MFQNGESGNEKSLVKGRVDALRLSTLQDLPPLHYQVQALEHMNQQLRCDGL